MAGMTLEEFMACERLTGERRRYRGKPPYHAYRKPLWTEYCKYVDKLLCNGRVGSANKRALSFGNKKASLIQRVMRGALARKRIKKYGRACPLPLQLLSSRVVVKTDMDLQHSRSILPPRGGNDIMDYLEKVLETKMKVDSTRGRELLVSPLYRDRLGYEYTNPYDAYDADNNEYVLPYASYGFY